MTFYDTIELGGSMNRLMAQALRTGNRQLLREILVIEINAATNPAALRTNSEHRYFRRRAKVLRRLAARKVLSLRETENGRVY